MNETKKKIPLALALCAAAVLSSLASLLTDLTTPYSNLSWSLHNLQSFFYPHSPRRILFMSIPSNSMVDTPFYLLLTLIISLLPLVMAVLLWKHRTKNQRKPVRVLCLVIAAAYLVRLVLNLVTMVMTPGSFELMNLAISLCTLLPMVIVIYTFLWAAGCIKKWMVKRGFVYVLLFYVLSGAWVLFTLLPPSLRGTPDSGGCLSRRRWRSICLP